MKKKWIVRHRVEATGNKRSKDILRTIMESRGISSREEWNEFVTPVHPAEWDLSKLGLAETSFIQLLSYLKDVREQGEKVLVYGDYDADGVCATAILVEYLQALGFETEGYIPDRRAEGYTMKVENIKKILATRQDLGMLITVDQGIVAHEVMTYLHDQSIRTAIVDHHEQAETLPNADVIIHSTLTSGSALAWLTGLHLSTLCERELDNLGLELACIGTVADVLPLSGFNRSLVWHGLSSLRTTTRPAIVALCELAGIEQTELDSYHIGFQLGPRINAIGRLEHAKVGYDLLTEKDAQKAKELANELEAVNKRRRILTERLVEQALSSIKNVENILLVKGKDYDEGVMGLIAGKLVEEYYRPAIVVCEKEDVSKASCRSVSGVHIVELLRRNEDLFEGVGGHAMAAGFSIKTERLDELFEQLSRIAETEIEADLLIPTLRVDCEVELSDLSGKLYTRIEELSPFGMGNSKPVFSSTNLTIVDAKQIGSAKSHLKLQVCDANSNSIEVLGFGWGEYLADAKPGSTVNLAYTLNQNTWRGKTSMQLLIKDLQLVS